MLQAVERWKAEIHQMIMSNMQAATSQADGYVERLEQEIMELQRRDAELRHILETEDNIHFLQVKHAPREKVYLRPRLSVFAALLEFSHPVRRPGGHGAQSSNQPSVLLRRDEQDGHRHEGTSG